MKYFLNMLIVSLFLTTFIVDFSIAQEKKLTGAANIIPPATEEMQHPEFWISRIEGGSKVILIWLS